jgi:ABC-type multidrug transport system ATPase subunit
LPENDRFEGTESIHRPERRQKFMKIRLEQVSKKYGSRVALNPTTLEINPGQIVAVLGANGAGKTTLLRCLSTIAAPTRGRILLFCPPLLVSPLKQHWIACLCSSVFNR